MLNEMNKRKSGHGPKRAASANPQGLPEPGLSRREFLHRAGGTLFWSGNLGNMLGLFESKAPKDGSGLYAAVALPNPRPTRLLENVWVPMRDGTRLAARIALPIDAEQNPVPAIFGFEPYRDRPNVAIASYGYASVVADLRGTGNSEGKVFDEYSQQEQDDAVEIIAWIAKQHWCSGKVGMEGCSWGGFSALQVAARRPPALKAIISRNASDDRYTDDAHYMGGCVLGDMFVWGAEWTSLTPLPPDPAVVGARWREMWMERLHSLDFFVGNWMEHPNRDAFWKHGSLDEDYSQIECPVYLVGGWVDAYHCAVPRMLQRLKCPRKGLIGPWTHCTCGDPQPAIDWLAESVRWWDHWLKGSDSGIMNEPMYRVFLQKDAINAGKHQVSGRWIAESAWPSTRIASMKLFLASGKMVPKPGREAARIITSPQTVGITAPYWLPFDLDVEAPTDQRLDDGRSLTFDSESLTQDIAVVGAPIVTLELSVDKPVAFLAVRLNEIAPDGFSTRVTYQVLNLTHRESDESPSLLRPGEHYRVRIPLRDCAYIFKAQHRIRLAISTTYWPLIWPSPERVTLTVFEGKSEFELPVRPAVITDLVLHTFQTPSQAATPAVSTQHNDIPRTGTEDDVERDELSVNGSPGLFYHWDVSQHRLVIQRRGGELTEIREICDDDPATAKVEFRRSARFKHADCDAKVDALLRMRAAPDAFQLHGEIAVFDHDREIFSRKWDRKYPRTFV